MWLMRDPFKNEIQKFIILSKEMVQRVNKMVIEYCRVMVYYDFGCFHIFEFKVFLFY